VGWQFELWEGDDGWKRFKKAVICAVLGYAKAYVENEEAPSDVMMQALLLEVRCMFEIDISNVVSAFILTPPSPPQSEHTNATTLHQTILDKTAEAAAACQQQLEAVEQGMGLSMPGRGVQAPTLGYKLDSFQVQALEELGRIIVSPSNAGDAAAAGLVTPCEVAGVGMKPSFSRGMSLGFRESLQALILGFACQMTQHPISTSPSSLQALLSAMLFFPQALA
jgi:hypothetical protein